MSNYDDRDKGLESTHTGVLRKFERKLDKARELDEAAHRKLRDHLSEGLSAENTKTRANVAKELLAARNQTSVPEQYKQDNASGYLAKARELDSDPITGYEPLPWNRNRN